MTKIKEVKNTQPRSFKFICPGCNCEHVFNDTWKFNYDFENPTVKPSVLVRGFLGFKNEEPFYGTCHSYIKNGKIRFLEDCSHDLKNQTVELIEFTT